jgi:hypothetical protein
MLRRITYRTAATAFVFTGLWFVLGLMALWSPVPGALGIRGQMSVAWLLLSFVILGGSGAMLTVAALNGIFPAGQPRGARRRAAAPAAASTTADGRPLPWSGSPLPQRPPRRGAATGASAASRPANTERGR